MPENPIIEIKDLSHRYDIQWVVKDIHYEIANRGIYGLLGANGAGKSTMMSIICGIIKPTRGVVRVRGIDVLKNPIEAKRHIGFLPQKPPLYEELTVEEYLTHAAEIHWVSDKEVKSAVGRVLEMCSISHFRKRLIKNLSGGYQQRVGIAQAMIHDPDIVIFDEPTNGLDPTQILDIRRLIKNIAEEHTVILSTHILSEVQAVCDQLFMLNQGQMVFSGKVEDFDNYISASTLYVAFDGEIPERELGKIKGVSKVEPLGANKYRLSFTDQQEASDRIVELSSERGWPLAELYAEKSSLDDIFAELSKK
ncbi:MULTISPECIES: ABC transporter ATP-binding protein [Butyricimonas]|uniref:ABC transporter ATP-binding protein n=1 Tax=Butyricimonas TaxID=574697 RepID=UPI0007FB5627|nr:MULTISPECIES: ATP-binding cassette domain-containing protein [Butyricimonas]